LNAAANSMISKKRSALSIMKHCTLICLKALLPEISYRHLPAAFSLLALGISGVVFASAGKQPEIREQPSAQEIMGRALARAEAQYESRAEALFESESISTVHSLDGENRITKTEQSRHKLYPVRGAVFEELVEKNGRPISDKERRNEGKKRQEFIREVEKRISTGEHPQPEKEPGIRFNHEFVDRYQFLISRIETIRGYRCWVIEFKPKDGKLPVKNRMDRALNQSKGRFWIAQDDYGLARLEFSLPKPFKYWGGFLAVIRNTDGRMNYRRVEPGTWLPLDFSLKLDIQVLMVKNIRRHLEIEWFDYKRISHSTSFFDPYKQSLNPMSFNR
jgi:hypothetical protein